MTLDQAAAMLLQPLTNPAIVGLLFLAVLDTVLGIAVAKFARHDFEFTRLADWLWSTGVRVFLGWLIVQEFARLADSGLFGPAGTVVGLLADYGSQATAFGAMVSAIVVKARELGLFGATEQRKVRRDRAHKAKKRAMALGLYYPGPTETPSLASDRQAVRTTAVPPGVAPHG
jgi:hypothetical protein